MTDLSRDQLHELYRYMRLTRLLEERFELLFKQGKIVGGLYRSLGQEAESVGSAYALEDGDWLGPGTRNMGAMLVRGATAKDMLLQYMAKADSPCGGKDNITHFIDPERGLLGPISPLGTMICTLSGVALAFKMRGEPRVAMTYIGEGGSRTGAAHEGTSLAAAQHLPLVLVLEDNGWAFATRTAEEIALEDMVDMAVGYGVHGLEADGNDVVAVYGAAREAVDRARSGGGMSIIAVTTYRMKGHAQHDAQKYVPKEELDEWRRNDPIDRYVRHLASEGLATMEELEAIDRGIDAELDAAVAEAEASPMPQPEHTLTEVYGGRTQPAPWARTL